MLEARLKEASTLKRLLDAIKELVSDANFECNDEGINLQAMDNSHVALVTVMLKEAGFENYRCDRAMPLGINVASLCKILKCAKDDDIVTLNAGDEADSLSLRFEAAKTERVAEYEMKLMDIDQEHLGIPDTSYDATVSMSSGEFQKICRDLTTLGESVKIEVTKEGVRFSSDGEIGSSTVLLKATSVNRSGGGGGGRARAKTEEEEDEGVPSPKRDKKVKKEKNRDDDEEEDDNEEIDVDEEEEEEEDDDDKPAPKRKAPSNGKASGSKAKKAKGDDEEEDQGVTIVLQQSVVSTFSLKYLLNFTKSAPLAKKVTLSMSDEIPMLVGFDFESGFINYYLAPKIGEE